METASTSYIWPEPSSADVPCQNCGKMVTIMVPFVGCVFCNDCSKGSGTWEANTEDFKQVIKGELNA